MFPRLFTVLGHCQCNGLFELGSPGCRSIKDRLLGWRHTALRNCNVCSTTLSGFVPVLTLYRLFRWCELWWRPFWLFPERVPNQIMIWPVLGDVSAGFIMPV
jgi:hypothetical protein